MRRTTAWSRGNPKLGGPFDLPTRCLQHLDIGGWLRAISPATSTPSDALMSSGSRQERLVDCRGMSFIVAHPPEDLVTDAPLERSDGLGLGITGGHALLDVVTIPSRLLQLGDRDAMEGQVELTVATAAESVPRLVARSDRHGRGDVVCQGPVRNQRRSSEKAVSDSPVPSHGFDRR